MLPRRPSIFHLGEEGGAVHHRAGLVTAAAMSGGGAGRRVREHERLVVGLKILVHHHHHGRHAHAHAHAANVIFKQMVKPRAAASRHGGAAPCISFLKVCSLCRLDLSPNKDVYMYRGDQGFCSEECRWQQILVDEAREREAAAAATMSKERQWRGQQARHHHPPHHSPIRGRPPPRKTLAVA